MKPANVAMLVVGIWMGVSSLAVGPGSWGGWGVAKAANAEVEGRKHARKANHLADTNKCKLAIPEYTKALRALKDPTLLFNRAECYRRIGASTKAVVDYRKFLVEWPAATNRAQVESQIAALDRPAGPPAAAAKPAPATAHTGLPAPAGKSATAPVAVAVPTPEPSPPPPAAPPPRPVVEEPVREAPATVAHEAPDLDEPRTLPPAPAPASREPAPTLIDSARRQPPAPEAEASASASHWWAWALGAVVIAGGAAGTYFLLKEGKTEIPSSTLGNYKF